MNTIATLGPEGSDGYQAARQYDPAGSLLLFNHVSEILDCMRSGTADRALIPVYNTREGEVKEYFRVLEDLEQGYWIDNMVLPIHLSLGAAHEKEDLAAVRVVVGRSTVFRQCEEYIARHMPGATLLCVRDLERAIDDLKANKRKNHVIIDSEEVIYRFGLYLLDREIAPYNRTRFAVVGKEPHPMTGYDATAVITRPLADRVGLLVDILNEFTRRGINILDLRAENDIRTQKLQIYLEIEGHRGNRLLQSALDQIENRVIQQGNALKILGSFPRVDMRIKKIKSFGFIGSGAMSGWFAQRLENEGYRTMITGRATQTTPEEMIGQVDVVVVCVPISATAATIERYGALLRDGQALIILAGESETPVQTALESTSPGVEVMLVHNLWGPQVISMKDKNAAIVRTPRSGSLCSEFESFLYKYGAEIYLDSPEKHDLLMGVSQKLPTTISVALAMTLSQHGISYHDIDSHSTLTSLYGILAMARVHNQNPRTYAEIMATSGEGKKIIASFMKNIECLYELANNRDLKGLCAVIDANREAMPPAFLKTKMGQAQAVDAVLSDIGFKGD